jgi:hypothetical protein
MTSIRPHRRLRESPSSSPCIAFVGLPEEGRKRMLEWAAATFDALGTLNERSEASFALMTEMIRYAGEIPDGWRGL